MHALAAGAPCICACGVCAFRRLHDVGGGVSLGKEVILGWSDGDDRGSSALGKQLGKAVQSPQACALPEHCPTTRAKSAIAISGSSMSGCQSFSHSKQ